MKHFKIILTAFILLAVTGITTAQTKIAHINSAELMEDYPKVQEVEKVLQQYRDAYSKRINRLEADIMNIQQQLRDSGMLLPEPEVEILNQMNQEKYEEWQRLQQEYQNKIVAKQEELLKPVIADLKKVISEVAIKEGYDYVLDSAEGGNVIYGSPSFDLMEAVRKKIAEITASEENSDSGTGGTGN